MICRWGTFSEESESQETTIICATIVVSFLLLRDRKIHLRRDSFMKRKVLTMIFAVSFALAGCSNGKDDA